MWGSGLLEKSVHTVGWKRAKTLKKVVGAHNEASVRRTRVNSPTHVRDRKPSDFCFTQWPRGGRGYPWPGSDAVGRAEIHSRGEDTKIHPLCLDKSVKYIKNCFSPISSTILAFFFLQLPLLSSIRSVGHTAGALHCRSATRQNVECKGNN